MPLYGLGIIAKIAASGLSRNKKRQAAETGEEHQNAPHGQG